MKAPPASATPTTAAPEPAQASEGVRELQAPVAPSTWRGGSIHVAGYPVETVTLPGTWHPERPRPCVDAGGFQRWVRVGAAPWTRAQRTLRQLAQWLDPDGAALGTNSVRRALTPREPWNLETLPGVLSAMGIPEIEDADRPTPHPWNRICPLPSHFETCLPAAQKAAAARYLAAVGASAHG